MDLVLNNLQRLICHKTQTTNHTFPKGISLKVNVLARVKFEIAYYNVAVRQVIH